MITIAVKVDKVRFFRCGYKPPANSNFKGIMTSSVFADYVNYTGREEAKEPDKTLMSNKKTGYLNYTASHHTGYTRSSDGVLDTEEKINEFKKKISNCFKRTGDIAWENVLSLESFDEASRYGLITNDDWEATLSKALPRFFKYAGFDLDNMIWWWDYHTNKFHPHVHIVWMEKEKRREVGKLSSKELKALKKYTAIELDRRKKLLEKIDTGYSEFFKEKDLKFNEILVSVEDYLHRQKNPDINYLYKILPKTGRLQMNSYHMKDYKPMIETIITDILQNDENVRNAYHDWINKIEALDMNINNIQKSDINNFKTNEIERLYTRIGNLILKEYKKERLEVPESLNNRGMKSISNNVNQHNDKLVRKNRVNKRYRGHQNNINHLSNEIIGLIQEQDQEMKERFQQFLIENGYYDVQI